MINYKTFLKIMSNTNKFLKNDKMNCDLQSPVVSFGVCGIIRCNVLLLMVALVQIRKSSIIVYRSTILSSKGLEGDL